MEISILKWDEYNSKRDLKTPFWFKVNVNIGQSRSLFGLSCSTKWVWICLLSEAMRQRSGKFNLNVEWASHFWGLKKSDIIEAVNLLNENGLLTLDSHSTPTTLPLDSHPEKSREEENRVEERATAEFVPKELREAWVKTYGDEKWIDFEIKKSQSWIVANKSKAPKSQFDRFYNGWLSRGWEQRRTSIPTKPLSAPSGTSQLSNTPDPRGGPLPTNIKSLLDKARGRSSDEPPGAA